MSLYGLGKTRVLLPCSYVLFSSAEDAGVYKGPDVILVGLYQAHMVRIIEFVQVASPQITAGVGFSVNIWVKGYWVQHKEVRIWVQRKEVRIWVQHKEVRISVQA